jgi:hypothetical protein
VFGSINFKLHSNINAQLAGLAIAQAVSYFSPKLPGFDVGFVVYKLSPCRSECLLGLRHELSFPAGIRIPREAWMSVCLYAVFVLYCV